MWLLPGALGYTALSIFSNALLAARAPGLSSLGSAAALGAGVALDLALIPVFGASGAAAAASVAFLAGGATVALLYRRAAGFPLARRWCRPAATWRSCAWSRSADAAAAGSA